MAHHDSPAGRALPFDLVESPTERVLLPHGQDLREVAPPCAFVPVRDSRTTVLDFSPARLIEEGIYPSDVASRCPAEPAPSGHPYRSEYKTPAFRDIIAGTQPGAVVLDLGCGNGELLRRFPAHALRIGMDISPQCLFLNTPNALDSGIDHIWIGSAVAVPVRDRTIDTILCCDLLEHLLEPGRILREIHRILKPGGTAIITVPNLVHVGNRLSMLAGSGVGVELAQMLKGLTPVVAHSGPRYPDQTIHLRWFTASSLSRWVGEHGLKVVRQFGCGPIATRLRLCPIAHSLALLTGVIAVKP